MEKPRIVIAGGSGFLGQALKRRLEENGREVVVLSRKSGTNALSWDGKTVGDWWAALDGAQAVINLTGKSIDCRYTPHNRKQILASRIDSVNAITGAISKCKRPPKAWLQASAIAIYGDAGDSICDEKKIPFPTALPLEQPGEKTKQSDVLPRKDFSANVCKAWERAFAGADVPKTRKVCMRTAVVLAEDGGALPILLKLSRAFLGGHAGNGNQYMSWIHRKDFENAVLFFLSHEELTGVFNLASPKPRTNRDFMAAVRKSVHRPWSPPVPAFAIEIGTRIMNTEAELVLEGRRVVPKRLQEAGFDFAFPSLTQALSQILSAGRPKQG